MKRIKREIYKVNKSRVYYVGERTPNVPVTFYCGYCKVVLTSCYVCGNKFKIMDPILCINGGDVHMHDDNLEKLSSGLVKLESANE